MSSQKAAVISFIQSLASKPDVWFVTNEQLLQWVNKNSDAMEHKDLILLIVDAKSRSS